MTSLKYKAKLYQNDYSFLLIELITPCFCLFVILLAIGPSLSSSTKLWKYSWNSSSLSTEQWDFRKSISMCWAWFMTAFLIIYWALMMSAVGFLCLICLNSLDSDANISSYSSSSIVAGSPNIIWSILLLLSFDFLKAWKRAKARSLSSLSPKVVVSTEMCFFRRVMRCFWKLWKMDLFFFWGWVLGVSSWIKSFDEVGWYYWIGVFSKVALEPLSRSRQLKSRYCSMLKSSNKHEFLSYLSLFKKSQS